MRAPIRCVLCGFLFMILVAGLPVISDAAAVIFVPEPSRGLQLGSGLLLLACLGGLRRGHAAP
jgi:hypothetical protein